MPKEKKMDQATAVGYNFRASIKERLCSVSMPCRLSSLMVMSDFIIVVVVGRSIIAVLLEQSACCCCCC